MQFLSFTQLGDVRSAINYTVEALKVGKDITCFSPGAHDLESATVLYCCHGVFTD